MEQKEKLPWDLIEEILSRVPSKSLVRFRTACKRWNALFDDKTFINNHKTTFRFILATESKIYSVSIDPKIVVHELTLDIPGLESQRPINLNDCNELLFCNMDEVGAVVCNPWLKQARWIKPEEPKFELIGIVYDDSNKRVDKTLWSYKTEWKIHDFASDAWKDVIDDSESGDSDQGIKRCIIHSESGVSLNGTLYWVAFYQETDPLYHLNEFDFSREGFFKFCDLPCGMKNRRRDALVLRVFKGDRFSLLKQCHLTKKIEIWVTKNKVDYDDDDVVWINLMNFSVPNLPSLVIPNGSYCVDPSYFIDDKRLVVCSCDESGRAWIYVFGGGNELISKLIKIDYVVGHRPAMHCTYFPSLVPVPPRCQREEAELQV